MYKVGFATRQLDCFEPGNVMLGWGTPDVKVEGVAMPLRARAMVAHDTRRESSLAYVCLETCFVSAALRQAVLEALERAPARFAIDAHSLMLTATHTHSGPSGFSQFLMMNVDNGGFSEALFHSLVADVVASIREAAQKAEPASLRVASAVIPIHEPVAFNRSLRAYARNRDVDPESSRSAASATRRVTVTLRADRVADGRPLGMINWFAVHGTSYHSDNRQLHPDNKGIAAALTEKEIRFRWPAGQGFVAIFAQEASGDVSPNYRIDPKRNVVQGGGASDRQSAELNGRLQARYALEAFDDARTKEPISGPLGGLVQHVDISRQTGQTRVPHMGIGFLSGTSDGHGPLYRIRRGLRVIAKLARACGLDPSLDLLDLQAGSRGRVLNSVPTRGVLSMLRLMPRLRYAWAAIEIGAADEAWAPQVLPIQLARIGSLLIAGLPTEPTTVAGERLRRALAGHCPAAGCVVINGYANAYAGYMTTPEEYDAQYYEGGATLFGRGTQPVFEAALVELLSQPFPGRGPVSGPSPSPADPARLAQERCRTVRRMRSVPLLSASRTTR